MSEQAQDQSEELNQLLRGLDEVLTWGRGARVLRLACAELASHIPLADGGAEQKPVAHLGTAVAEGELTMGAAWEQCDNYLGNWAIANAVLAPDPDLAKTIRHIVWMHWHSIQDVVLEVLRCIVGNPFRPVTFNSFWRTEHTIGLAARMYDERDFRAMPILADALEEAGCDSADVLSHCREPGPHARGCWVVDGVLGKR